MSSLRLEVLLLVSLTSFAAAAPPSAPQADRGVISSSPTHRAGGVHGDAATDLFHAEDEPHYPDLQVLFIMNWRHPGAEAELRRLEEIGGVFERLRDRGWKVGIAETDNLRIVSDDQVRPLVDRLKFQRYPAVVAVHDGDVIRSFQDGCTTPLDEYTFEWMRNGVSNRPADAPLLTATVPWSGTYPLRGSHWSVDGSYSPTQEHLLRHLRGANHRHLIPADWAIETWSYEELRSLHDDLHERNRPRELAHSRIVRSRPMPTERSRTVERRYVPAALIP